MILLTFTDNVNVAMESQMFELFSGKGAVSGVFKRAGVATISFDMELDPGQKTMDFLSEAGFAFQPQV